MRPSHRKRNRDWPRRRRVEIVSTSEALKEVIPEGGWIVARPWPYKLAYDRRWISAGEYYAAQPERIAKATERLDLVGEYASALYALLKKDTTW